MKKTISLLIIVLLVGCNSQTEDKKTENIVPSKTTSKNVSKVSPCELFGTEELAKVFAITDKNLIEMYPREKSGSHTNQCQFIWQEATGSVRGSQVMIDITHKSEDMGATFSRMLELHLQNGLTARENNQTITILPTPLADFGEFAYHWAQPSFQQTQIISFQKDDTYLVKITFNCHQGLSVSSEEIKTKLIKIASHIHEQL